LYKFKKLAELRGKSPEMDWEDATVLNVNADGDEEKKRGGGDARKEFP